MDRVKVATNRRIPATGRLRDTTQREYNCSCEWTSSSFAAVLGHADSGLERLRQQHLH